MELFITKDEVKEHEKSMEKCNIPQIKSVGDDNKCLVEILLVIL